MASVPKGVVWRTPAATAATLPRPVDPALLFGKELNVGSTAAQREIFSASLSDPSASRGYNHSIAVFLAGDLDRDALYSALLNLLHRHEALRGRFSADGGRFLVRERIAFELPVTDLNRLPEAERQREYERLVREELDHAFDLLEGPLFRALLVHRGHRNWVLVFNCHHAVVDGWSLKIILEELPKLYSALAAGRETAALAVSASFVDYLAVAAARERECADAVRAFWRGVYADGVPALDLPADHPRPRFRTYGSLREDYRVDRGVYQRLKAAGAKRGASQFVTLLSAFSLFMYRISGQRDHVVGVPAAGQIKSGKSGLLGHDSRLLPIRCTVEEPDSFATFSRRVRDRFLSAYENQWITIPELLRELDVELQPARVPLASVMFNFDPGMDGAALHFEGLQARHFFNHRNAETFEISVNAVVEGDDLVLECAYNRALFDAAGMHQRLAQFEQLMASIGEQPDDPVSALRLVPADQVVAMDAALNSTAMEFERDLCVDQLIERAVLVTPDKVAVECGATQLTYRQLWERSGHVAMAVLHAGLGPRPLVGVMLERSADLVAVLLGVWRAGAAFVPLDPAYPADRLDYMIEHSEMGLLLTERAHGRTLGRDRLRRIDVAEIGARAAAGASLPATRQAADLAYVIYTSGSTGKPKGVQVPHRALHNLLTTMRTRAPGITPSDRLLAVTTLSFDIAELELWLPLVAGATTVVADRATSIDGPALMRVLREAGISFLQATPATWRLLLFAGWEGDNRLTALCGGEALSPDLAAELRRRVGTLWNVYGPTETTVWSTIDRVVDDAVTIGRPIGNTQAYVLDGHNAWVPRGCAGELWLGGDGVTQGYLGREDLTRERFVPNPFTGSGRVYRTGDLVRLLRDDRLEYVGRNDSQVKVRGYRIELGEVQHALSRLPPVRQCVAVVREREPGDAHLIAFYTLNSGAQASAQELKSSLRASLPEYMVPGWFVELERLPLTDNGKVDVRALPDPFQAARGLPSPALARAEAALADHPCVAAVALVVPSGSSADSRPVAFVVPRAEMEPTVVDLRKHLLGRCPEAVVPAHVVALESLPMTRKKGVDRDRLRELMPGAPATGGAASGSSDSPRTATEIALAEAWKDVLGIARVGTRDNFFDLGGHSLLSIQMIVRVARDTGRRLKPRQVLLETLGELAAGLDKQPRPDIAG
jgi:amino acid adenylation domain-containing protein